MSLFLPMDMPPAQLGQHFGPPNIEADLPKHFIDQNLRLPAVHWHLSSECLIHQKQTYHVTLLCNVVNSTQYNKDPPLMDVTHILVVHL